MSRRTRLRTKRDDGATAVEFAIVAPVVFAVCFFALYGALYFFYSAVASHVARAVVRQVSIPISQTGSGYPDSSQATLNADASTAAGSMLPSPTSVTSKSAPATGTPQQGDFVTITVTYKLPVLDQLASLIPGMSAMDTITSTASGRRQ
jgi:Flp pilus assembly protein TadG